MTFSVCLLGIEDFLLTSYTQENFHGSENQFLFQIQETFYALQENTKEPLQIFQSKKTIHWITRNRKLSSDLLVIKKLSQGVVSSKDLAFLGIEDIENSYRGLVTYMTVSSGYRRLSVNILHGGELLQTFKIQKIRFCRFRYRKTYERKKKQQRACVDLLIKKDHPQDSQAQKPFHRSSRYRRLSIDFLNFKDKLWVFQRLKMQKPV